MTSKSDKPMENTPDMVCVSSSAVAHAVSNKFMEAVFHILDALDLSYTASEAEDQPPDMDALSLSADTLASVGDITRLKPNRPRDFEIFYKMAELLNMVLRKCPATLVSWLQPLASVLSNHSTVHPQISGFYRMLTATVIAAAENGCFKHCNDSDAMELDGAEPVPSDSKVFAELVQRFVREVCAQLCYGPILICTVCVGDERTEPVQARITCSMY